MNLDPVDVDDMSLEIKKLRISIMQTREEMEAIIEDSNRTITECEFHIKALERLKRIKEKQRAQNGY